MPWSRKDIVEQFAMIRAAPVPCSMAVVAIIGVVWVAFNWSYSSIISSKNSQIELLDRQIADCNKKPNDGSPSEAKARIDTVEARLSRIEPRRLSHEQKKTFLKLERKKENHWDHTDRKITTKVGDRWKPNRRNATMLARLHRAGPFRSTCAV